MNTREANPTFPYIFAWRNNEKRATLYGRRLRVIARSKSMNSAWVEFADGQQEVICRSALRMVAGGAK